MSAKKYDFVPKTDVRQLIKVSKDQSKRINHPHARYNQLGRISCIVCGVQIKSEHAWNAHIISKTHKQNEAREAQAALKRSTEGAPAQLSVPTKRPKPDGDKDVPPTGREISISQTRITSETTSPSASSSSPPPPTTAAKIPTDTAALGEKNPAEKTRDDLSGSKLPEGFFDDRYKDAKVRNVPYKDKLTEEMEVFQKEMISLEKKSDEIMEKESEAMVSGRELEEIDAQIQKWERIKQLQTEVEILETKRREKITSNTNLMRTGSGEELRKKEDVEIKEEPDSDSSDLDDELYDFRTKNIV